MLNMDKTFICLTIGLLAINTVIEATNVTPICQPFSAFFLWHTGFGEDSSFFLHRRLLIESITQLPENTNVSIVTFGAENNLSLNFTKQAGDTNWRDTILNYMPGNDLNYGLSNKEINQTISNHYRINKSSKAEIVYILVSDRTEILDEESDHEAFRIKKTFMILSGIQTMSKTNYWLKQATNEHHFVEFYRDEDIKKTVDAILVVSCQDSKFVCDTHMYWWYEKGRCNTCTYICVKSCSKRSEYCNRACPFFHQCELSTDITKVTDDSSESHEHEANSGVVSVISVVIGILLTFVVYKKRKTFIRFIIRYGKG